MQPETQPQSETAGLNSLAGMDYLPLGILALDRDLSVRFWNACLESWTGMGREEIRGKKVCEVFPQINRPLVVDRLKSLFAGGPPVVFSYHLHGHLIPSPLPGGKLRMQHSVAYGLKDDKGEIGHAVISLQDVTEIYTRLQENLRIQAELGQENERRKEVEAKLLEMATVDFLTGARNRRSFLEKLGEEVARSKRYGRPLTLLALDLDHFKNINDYFGHAAGDTALTAFCTVCRGELRQTDFLGRLGGEEFAVFLPETGADMGKAVANRILDAVRRARVLPDQDIRLTVSIGLAELTPTLDATTLLNLADQALYAAKRQGRDRLAVALEANWERNIV